MDITDFEGCAVLKCILPLIYCLHILLMLVGPSCFPRQYQLYNFGLIMYLTLRSLLTLAYSIIGVGKTHAIVDRVQEMNQHKYKQKMQELPISPSKIHNNSPSILSP